MDKNRILIIEDEASIRELLAMNLEAVGYKVDLAEDGVKAEQKIPADQGLYDLALVDVMLPGPGGFDLIGSLNQKEIPCIFLTAKADVASKVKGLRLGAEDYMVKPFEMMELFARVENVLKRRKKLKDFMEIDKCRIDLASHKVYEEGEEISLKPMEYDLFLFFCRNQNVAFTRNQLLDRIWGGDYGGETRTVDVHVASLRRKLKAGSRIQTIPKLGYRLEV